MRAAGAQGAGELAGTRGQHGGQLVRAGHELPPGLAQLQRQPGVEHVRRGQAEVDPAPRLAHRRGDDVDERGDVVVGDPLALAHRLGVEGGAGLDLLEVVRPGSSLLGQRLADRQLDLQPGLELALLRPDGPISGRV